MPVETTPLEEITNLRSEECLRAYEEGYGLVGAAVDGGPAIYFERSDIDDIFAMAGLLDQEITGFGIIEKNGSVFQTNGLIVPEQVVSGASAEVDSETVAKLIVQMAADGVELAKVKLWWHSHVNMSTFWSGTDNNTIEILGQTMPYLFSIVVNHKGEYRLRFDMFDPIRVKVDNMKLMVYRKDEQDYVDHLETIIGEKLKKYGAIKRTTPIHSGMAGWHAGPPPHIPSQAWRGGGTGPITHRPYKDSRAVRGQHGVIMGNDDWHEELAVRAAEVNTDKGEFGGARKVGEVIEVNHQGKGDIIPAIVVASRQKNSHYSASFNCHYVLFEEFDVGDTVVVVTHALAPALKYGESLTVVEANEAGTKKGNTLVLLDNMGKDITDVPCHCVMKVEEQEQDDSPDGTTGLIIPT